MSSKKEAYKRAEERATKAELAATKATEGAKTENTNYPNRIECIFWTFNAYKTSAFYVVTYSKCSGPKSVAYEIQICTKLCILIYQCSEACNP